MPIATFFIFLEVSKKIRKKPIIYILPLSIVTFLLLLASVPCVLNRAIILHMWHTAAIFVPAWMFNHKLSVCTAYTAAATEYSCLLPVMNDSLEQPLQVRWDILLWSIAYACIVWNVTDCLFPSKYPLTPVSPQVRNSASAISPALPAWSSRRASQINTHTIWSAPTWSSPRPTWTSPSRSWPLTWKMTPCWWERVIASTTG